MKRILAIVAIAFCLFTLTAPDAWARGRMSGYESGGRGVDCYECCHQGAGGRGADCAGVRTYSRAAFETVSGEIIDVIDRVCICS